MSDETLVDFLLKLELRITKLESHFHTYTEFDGNLGSRAYERITSKPNFLVEETDV